MGLGTCNKFNNAVVERVLWWSHYFSKLVASSIPGSIAAEFLSLGLLKENVYKNNLHTLEELKQNIQLYISSVTAETLHRVA
jgi:hypothetical protein